MISRRPALAGSSKGEPAVEATGAEQRRVEMSARLVAAISSRLVAGGSGRRICRWAGRYRVGHVDELGPQLLQSGRLVERLHLHEQLVDDAADAFTGDRLVGHQPGGLP